MLNGFITFPLYYHFCFIYLQMVSFPKTCKKIRWQCYYFDHCVNIYIYIVFGKDVTTNMLHYYDHYSHYMCWFGRYLRWYESIFADKSWWNVPPWLKEHNQECLCLRATQPPSFNRLGPSGLLYGSSHTHASAVDGMDCSQHDSR